MPRRSITALAAAGSSNGPRTGVASSAITGMPAWIGNERPHSRQVSVAPCSDRPAERQPAQRKTLRRGVPKPFSTVCPISVATRKPPCPVRQRQALIRNASMIRRTRPTLSTTMTSNLIPAFPHSGCWAVRIAAALSNRSHWRGPRAAAAAARLGVPSPRSVPAARPVRRRCRSRRRACEAGDPARSSRRRPTQRKPQPRRRSRGTVPADRPVDGARGVWGWNSAVASPFENLQSVVMEAHTNRFGPLHPPQNDLARGGPGTLVSPTPAPQAPAGRVVFLLQRRAAIVPGGRRKRFGHGGSVFEDRAQTMPPSAPPRQPPCA